MLIPRNDATEKEMDAQIAILNEALNNRTGFQKNEIFAHQHEIKTKEISSEKDIKEDKT